MSPLSIIFCGTPDFAVPSLKALLEDDAFDVMLVITQPSKPVGRKRTLTPPPIKVLAERSNIPVFQPRNINAELPSYLEDTDIPPPDFLVVVAYGQILKSPLLALPRIAPVNVHASLLPRWRGASPYQNAILAGDTETGVTLQRIVEALDEGPVIAQERTHIDPRETASSLHDRLAMLGGTVLPPTLKAIDESSATETQQDDSTATVCRKLTRSDGVCNPKEMTAEEIDQRVRALNPWPGVTCPIDGKIVKLLETALQQTDTEGQTALALPCKEDTTLFIEKLLPPGKRPMTGAEFQRGT